MRPFRLAAAVTARGVGATIIVSAASVLAACNASTPEPRAPSARAAYGTAGSETLACVEFQAEVVYRNEGYDHLVHLRSRCERAAVCTVATDVNPTPVDVTVPPRQQLTVLTFRGSPAREFTPYVTCRFESEGAPAAHLRTTS